MSANNAPNSLEERIVAPNRFFPTPIEKVTLFLKNSYADKFGIPMKSDEIAKKFRDRSKTPRKKRRRRKIKLSALEDQDHTDLSDKDLKGLIEAAEFLGIIDSSSLQKKPHLD